jgi:hypothetical protein
MGFVKMDPVDVVFYMGAYVIFYPPPPFLANERIGVHCDNKEKYLKTQ